MAFAVKKKPQIPKSKMWVVSMKLDSVGPKGSEHMARVLLCTGKKKKVQAIVDYYRELQKKKKLTILAMTQKTKRALFWNYDELKILFEPKAGEKHEPQKLLDALDTHAYRDQAMVIGSFRSPRLEDKMLKMKILTVCHAYVGKNVKSKVDLQEYPESQYRVYYQCSVELKGPVGPVVSCIEEMKREKLCDGKSVSYLF